MEQENKEYAESCDRVRGRMKEVDERLNQIIKAATLLSRFEQSGERDFSIAKHMRELAQEYEQAQVTEINIDVISNGTYIKEVVVKEVDE